jgi:hypothetical protein
MRVNRNIIMHVISVMCIIAFPLSGVVGIYNEPHEGVYGRRIFNILVVSLVPFFAFGVIWIFVKHRNCRLFMAFSELRPEIRLLYMVISVILLTIVFILAKMAILAIRPGH